MKCLACGSEIIVKEGVSFEEYCNLFCKKQHEILKAMPENIQIVKEQNPIEVVKYDKINLFGRRYESCTFENYKCDCEEQRKVLIRVKKISEQIKNGSGKIISFAGNPGTGKDHLAAAMIDYIKPKRARHTTIMKLSREVRESKFQQKIIDSYAYLNILILNEIGVQSVTSFERNILHEIIDTIYRNIQSCLLISNEGTAKFKLCIDDPENLRVWDRINEKITFTWNSYRQGGK